MPITGDKELAAALRALGKGIPTSSIDRSMTNAAQPMVADAKERAKAHRQEKRPKGGHIDENLKLARKKDSSKSRRRFVLGAFGDRKSVLTWLEFGTSAHWQPRRFGGILHPGARPFPVMRPAFDAHSNDTIDRFGTEIWKEIERLVAKYGKAARRR